MSSDDGSVSSVLLERARTGDRDALDALFERFAGKLLALIRLRMGNELRRRLESRDVLQAVMLKAFERSGQFRGDAAVSFMGWLARIAENEIRDQAAFHHRQRRDAGRGVALDELAAAGRELADTVRSASSRIVWNEAAERLERVLEGLDPVHREVVVLRRFEELGYAEIGRRLGKSPDACRMLFARAMTTLTVRMKEAGEPASYVPE